MNDVMHADKSIRTSDMLGGDDPPRARNLHDALIERSGHYIPEGRTDTLAGAITDFLTKYPMGRRGRRSVGTPG